MPLSKTITLGLWCGSLLEEFQTKHEKSKQFLATLRALMILGQNVDKAKLKSEIELGESEGNKLEILINRIKNGEAIDCVPENVVFYNSLQVRPAHRYVISSKKDFDLVNRMIADNEKYRHGLKPTIG